MEGYVVLKWPFEIVDNELTNRSKKHLAYNNKTKITMSFAIANNLLAPNTKATDLGISHEQQ
jgi:hypothetical protein